MSRPPAISVDCIVIGAGVVGLACAAELARRGREVLVLEAAHSIGTGTSSRNSEVIHAGIYYPAGSLKARLCREGRDLLYDYCAARGIAHRRVGKFIVAVNAQQHDRLTEIHAAARANDVTDLAWVSASELARIEPAISGQQALYSPSTGIVDSHALMLALEGDVASAGGIVVLRAAVTSGRVVKDRIVLEVAGDEPMSLGARCVVNSAGLHAPALARQIAGIDHASVPQSHYAIGHYYRLSGRAPVEHLIYPVPEAGGLGIHLTIDLGGQVKFGPDVRWIDGIDYAFDDSRFDGFVTAIQSYFPGLDPARLHPDYTGIRPKIAGPGAANADFRIDGAAVHGVPSLVNLYGIESPGLTAALAIGRHVAAAI